MEGRNETQLRIAVNGDYDKGLHITYKSTMGGEISIPAMLVEKIDIN
ncbi:hypothetical protein JDS88_16425 [Bacillus cereus]|nr:hypothetical protein [Bacillus cereus]